MPADLGSETQHSNPSLIRGIRRWDLVAMTINAIIGAGIFGLPAKVYALIGVYSIFAFIVCAVVVALIILCFAEVSSRFDETGGPYLYARAALGPAVGFEVGWLMYLARLTAFAANANLLINYLSYFAPSALSNFWRPAIIVTVVAALTLVNVVGIRQATYVGNIFTVGKLLPMIAFIAVGLFFIQPANYQLGPLPATAAFSQGVLLLIYGFSGFEMSTVPAAEIKDPQTQLPRALLVALGVVAALYILIQVVCVGTLPELAQSQKPLADAGARFMGRSGGALISAGAVVSIIGNLNILVLAGSRIPYAMAEQHQLPSFIGKIHKKSATPNASILITAAIILFFTLNTSFVAALTISALARLATYASTCIALPVLRRRADSSVVAFHLPAGTPIAILSLLLIVWLLAHSTEQEAITTIIVALVGIPIYVGYRLYLRFS